ncbi:MAG: hypothetical protein ACRCX2_24000 [Paraclostridium sp.]
MKKVIDIELTERDRDVLGNIRDNKGCMSISCGSCIFYKLRTMNEAGSCGDLIRSFGYDSNVVGLVRMAKDWLDGVFDNSSFWNL